MRCFVIAVNVFFAIPHSLLSTLADGRSKMTRRQPCSPSSGHLLSTEIDTGCENDNAFVSCRPAGEAHAHCAKLETPGLMLRRNLYFNECERDINRLVRSIGRNQR
jgi:hypothetical protein